MAPDSPVTTAAMTKVYNLSLNTSIPELAAARSLSRIAASPNPRFDFTRYVMRKNGPTHTIRAREEKRRAKPPPTLPPPSNPPRQGPRTHVLIVMVFPASPKKAGWHKDTNPE